MEDLRYKQVILSKQVRYSVSDRLQSAYQEERLRKLIRTNEISGTSSRIKVLNSKIYLLLIGAVYIRSKAICLIIVGCTSLMQLPLCMDLSAIALSLCLGFTEYDEVILR